jgi:S-adenosylmethionine:tRNA ribosyltransferase-isomerase
MRLSDFDFELPPELIAQTPAPSREASRLMVLERALSAVKTGPFKGIVEYFRPGDVLVLNDTRVIPARLLGVKESGGKIEVLLVRRLPGEEEVWTCLTKSSKPPRAGSRILIGGEITGTVVEGGDAPYRHIRFAADGDFLSAIDRIGHIPLPPYIRRDDNSFDRERYQTVFAKAAGAVAAPTAGLHFTEALLETLRKRGVTICPVTLHVGLGTFLPVRSDDILGHRMHQEDFIVPEGTAEIVNLARARGDRIIALGTTSTRTLEYAADGKGRLRPGEGVCDLFITPGYRFRVVDALITNFHLPRSTLLMLVAAFAGRDFVLEAYRKAVSEGFRFFSYGDCMLIV